MFLEYFHISEDILGKFFLSLFLISFSLCALITIFNPAKYIQNRLNDDLKAVQSAHSQPTPRLGGLALLITMCCIFPLAEYFKYDISVLFPFLISLIPMILVGTSEDLGFAMAPRRRLLAISVSSMFVMAFYSSWASRAGIPYVDDLLAVAPAGIALTLFITVGVTNAFNLIDGLNGLTAFTAMTIAISLSISAYIVGQIDICILSLTIIPIILGFFILNFPFGKIFLGDCGAYLLGFTLIWTAIILITSENSVSPFAIILIFFWPVADTLLAIWRRKTLGKPGYLPDRLHYHQLMMRFLEIRFFGRTQRRITNPLATLALIPLITAPQVLGLLTIQDSIMAAISLFISALIFVSSYMLGISLSKRNRLHPKPNRAPNNDSARA